MNFWVKHIFNETFLISAFYNFRSVEFQRFFYFNLKIFNLYAFTQFRRIIIHRINWFNLSFWINSQRFFPYFRCLRWTNFTFGFGFVSTFEDNLLLLWLYFRICNLTRSLLQNNGLISFAVDNFLNSLRHLNLLIFDIGLEKLELLINSSHLGHKSKKLLSNERYLLACYPLVIFILEFLQYRKLIFVGAHLGQSDTVDNFAHSPLLFLHGALQLVEKSAEIWIQLQKTGIKSWTVSTNFKKHTFNLLNSHCLMINTFIFV